MKTNLKIGDKIICHTICKIDDHDTTTIGESYTIHYINKNVDNNDNEFYIIDDDGDNHYFHNSVNSCSSYKKWFYPPIKIQRKEKLKKIFKLNE